MHSVASWMDVTGGLGSRNSLSALHLKTARYLGVLAAASVKIASAERSCKYTNTHVSTSPWETVKSVDVKIHCHTLFSFKSCPARDCHEQHKCVGHFVDSFVMSHIEECIVACNSEDDCNW